MSIFINDYNAIYSLFSKVVPYQGQKYSQLIEPATTNLIGNGDLTLDSNQDNIPDFFNPATLTYINDSDIFSKSYQVLNFATQKGFYVNITNKSTQVTSYSQLQIYSNNFNISQNQTYTLSFEALNNNATIIVFAEVYNSSNTLLQNTQLNLSEVLSMNDNSKIYAGTFTTPANSSYVKFKFQIQIPQKQSGNSLINHIQLENRSYWTTFQSPSKPAGLIITDLGDHVSLTNTGYFYIPPSKKQNYDAVLISIGKPFNNNSITLYFENSYQTLALKVIDNTGQIQYEYHNISYDPSWNFFQLAYQQNGSGMDIKLFINSTKVLEHNIASINWDYDNQSFKKAYIGHSYSGSTQVNQLNGFVSALRGIGGYFTDSKILDIYNNQKIYSSTRSLVRSQEVNATMLGGLSPTEFATATHSHDDRYYVKAEQDDRFVNVTGDTITGSLTIDGSLSVKGGINTNNTDITVNNVNIVDPGPGEGIKWLAGNGWAIYESPNDLTTNSAGNLQFVKGSSRILTLDTNGDAEFTGNIIVQKDIKTGADTFIWTNNSGSGYTGFWDQKNSKILLKVTEGGTIQLGDQNQNQSVSVLGSLNIKTSGSSNYISIYTETGTQKIADTFADTTTHKSYIYFYQVSGSNDPAYIMHETSETAGEANEGVLHLCPSDDNAYGDYVSIHGTNDPDVLKLHTDGTIEGVKSLTASELIKGKTLQSTVATGTAPLTVQSTTVVTNLNSDMLDGLHSSQFLSSNTDSEQTIGGKIFYFNNGEMKINVDPRWNSDSVGTNNGNLHIWATKADGSTYGQAGIALYNGTNGKYHYIMAQSGYWTRFQNPNGYIDIGPSNTLYAHIYTDRPAFYFNKELYVNNNIVWHSGNDGHTTDNSGPDADMLDGMQPSSSNTQNTIVQRDASGNFSQGTITATLNGNASTQSKLATQRTISLGGDLSGSASFDGSQNITITADVKYTVITETLANQLQQNTNHDVQNAKFESGEITVVRDGIHQIEGIDYIIVDQNTIKFTYSIPSGSVIQYRYIG